MDDNAYIQKVFFLEMDAIATRYGRDRKEMFRALMVVPKYLCSSKYSETLENWKNMVKRLLAELKDEDKDIVYKVLATYCYKYEMELAREDKSYLDNMIKSFNLDGAHFYDYYCDGEIRQYAEECRKTELMDRKIRALMEIAESCESSPFIRMKAWKEIDVCMKTRGDGNKGHKGISDKKEKVEDVTKSVGQGSREFRERLKELDEIALMENEHDKS